MAFDKRKVHFSWTSPTAVVITTPFKQRKFDASVVGMIDLVTLKVIPDDEAVEVFDELSYGFFVDFTFRETDSRYVGFIYAYHNSEEYTLINETDSLENNNLTVEVSVWIEE